MNSRPASLWILTSPAFVAAVLILLANDLVLKRLAPGLLTGKLSDFTGLFAFAVFGSALFVPFPLDRTVDVTDLLALAVLPLAYRYSQRWRGNRPSPRLLAASIAVASLAEG